jgi:murein DD-endopeptidase MepM/ murein hydrolase activator NlpD
VTGTINRCPNGTKSFYQSIGMSGHSGLDISAIKGEDIYHAGTFDGWWKADHDNAGGLGVDVVSNEPLFFPFPIPSEIINSAVPCIQNGIHGFTHHVKIRYWHLSKQVGTERKPITIGAVIGLAGNTGASSGVHLHFAPKWCLPDGRGVGNSNGTVGAFDPTPYYNHEITALDFATATKQEPEPLTPVEVKDIMEQISLIRVIILALQKLIYKL